MTWAERQRIPTEWKRDVELRRLEDRVKALEFSLQSATRRANEAERALKIIAEVLESASCHDLDDDFPDF